MPNSSKSFQNQDSMLQSQEEDGMILACLDLTAASSDAIRYASNLAKTNNWQLQILAVNEASHKNLLFGSVAIGSQKQNQIEKHIKKLVEEFCVPQGINPKISIREGEILTEIIREVKSHQNCKMLVFGKASSAQSDNTVLPRIIGKLGSKINVPMLIIPQGSCRE